jgi:hypothetical protein
MTLVTRSIVKLDNQVQFFKTLRTGVYLLHNYIPRTEDTVRASLSSDLVG